MADIEELQRRIDNVLSGRGKGNDFIIDLAAADETTSQQWFSEFFNPHQERAVELASRLMQIADEKGGDEGLADAVTEIERARDVAEMPRLVQHATKLFLTHHPGARARLRLKPLEQRLPDLVRPSMASNLDTGTDATFREEEISEGEVDTTSPEDKLDFWREDPLVNDHHEHWHLVYPLVNRFPGRDPRDIGDRHGELFAYMHEQMLARYDAERLAAGLPRVEPWPGSPADPDDYEAEIPEGYDPEKLWDFNSKGWFMYRERPGRAEISDLTIPGLEDSPGARISELRTSRRLLGSAGDEGHFVINGRQETVNADNFGNTVESNINSIDPRGDTYGSLHNMGHTHFAHYDNDGRLPIGVMGNPATALRDPIFWRWHKHIDSVFQNWQEDQQQDLSDAPPVKIRKNLVDGTASSPDIILCLRDGLPAQLDGEKLGSGAFGHSDDPDLNNWDRDFASTTVTLPDGKTVTTTDELLTEMLQRMIDPTDPDGNPFLEPIEYLSHGDFYYFIRVENLSDQAQSVTVRIFLGPETEVEDRTSWIELDRFLYRLEGSERAVIFRPADLSSVIRKPARKPEALTPVDPPPQTLQEAWCDCGWPYTLLLPRGTEEGMEFRLFVMFSPGDDLKPLEEHAEHEEHTDERCTSISYCGLQDWVYPDRQEMGYPFNRPFPDSISATVGNRDNMAWRTIKIRCRNL